MPWDSNSVVRDAERALAQLRAPIEAARTQQQQRIAARRAASAARVAHAHQVEMAAEWRPSVVPSRAAVVQESLTPARITRGFEDYPRTMAEVLARAAAYRRGAA